MANLITLTNPRSATAEALRTLRTNLMYSSVENPLHTLLVTSPAKAEDKSTLLANLAVTFAQSGNKTILVDADMRRPTQHDLWGVPNDSGLATMMIEDKQLSTPPLVSIDEVENLQLLPSGGTPSIPADMLASQRMNEIIGVLKARADYVLFDAPPVLAATDAAILGNKLNGVLLVIRAGTTRRDDAMQARRALERVNVHVVGAALSNAPKERRSSQYTY